MSPFNALTAKLSHLKIFCFSLLANYQIWKISSNDLNSKYICFTVISFLALDHTVPRIRFKISSLLQIYSQCLSAQLILQWTSLLH